MVKILAPTLALALAAVAGAEQTGSALAEANVSYTLGSNMTASFSAVSLNGRTAGRYVYDDLAGDYSGSATPVVYDFEAGGSATDPSLYTFSHTGTGTGSVSGNQITLSASMDAALTGSSGQDFGFEALYGYRLFLQVTNNGTASEDVVFDFDLQRRTISGSIDRPYVNPINLGAEVYAGAYGEIYDTSESVPGDHTLEFGTFPSNVPTFSDSVTYPTEVRTFSLGAGQTAEYQIYVSTRLYLNDDFAPVPEPASMLALGAGVLGLLRRRRR